MRPVEIVSVGEDLRIVFFFNSSGSFELLGLGAFLGKYDDLLSVVGENGVATSTLEDETRRRRAWLDSFAVEVLFLRLREHFKSERMFI